MAAWFDRLFHRQPSENPEDHERVRCDLCNGTGMWMHPPDPHGPPSPYKYNQHCVKCHGKGWLMVHRDTRA